jgi:hypothetical protein
MLAKPSRRRDARVGQEAASEQKLFCGDDFVSGEVTERTGLIGCSQDGRGQSPGVGRGRFCQANKDRVNNVKETLSWDHAVVFHDCGFVQSCVVDSALRHNHVHSGLCRCRCQAVADPTPLPSNDEQPRDCKYGCDCWWGYSHLGPSTRSLQSVSSPSK